MATTASKFLSLSLPPSLFLPPFPFSLSFLSCYCFLLKNKWACQKYPVCVLCLFLACGRSRCTQQQEPGRSDLLHCENLTTESLRRTRMQWELRPRAPMLSTPVLKRLGQTARRSHRIFPFWTLSRESIAFISVYLLRGFSGFWDSQRAG